MTPEEQAKAAVRVIAKDFYIYCERNLMIKDKQTNQLIPFILNWAQKLLVDRVLDDLEHGRPVRYIILKARQMGLSTVIEALCYWWTATHRYVNSVIIAHETEASSNLYKIFRRYYDHSHEFFQPDRKYNTKKDLVFDVEDEVKAHYREIGLVSPGLGSEIKTLVAREGKGRSDTINFFHGSEVAFWESGADILSSAVQAVPIAPNTFIFLESTANGIGGYFYDEWQLAKKGDSSFTPIFFPWHKHSEYELPGIVEVYDEEELELLGIFKEEGYPGECWPRKILWRRAKKREFRSDQDKFYQEYPKDDMEAFLASGRPVFDTRTLIAMETRARKLPPPLFGIIKTNPDIRAKERFIFENVTVAFQGQETGLWKIWELPEKGEKYVMGVDVSEGKMESSSNGKENDYSVCTILKKSNLKTVARWRGHIDPDLLGDVAFDGGMFYNTALIGVEVNNQGLTTVQSLRNKFYRNLYQRETDEEEQFQTRTSKLGWRTDRKTKKVIIGEMTTAIREGDIIDYDIVFIRECMTYVRDDQGYTDAQKGTFDDTVMSEAIALHISEWNTYDQQEAKNQIRKPTKRNTDATANSKLESIATGGRVHSTSRDAIRRRREARLRHRSEIRRRHT